MRPSATRLLPCLLLALAGARAARAEIAVLSNGLTMKLDGHRTQDAQVILVLRGGGELEVPAALVRGFVPDEVVEELAVSAGGVRALAAGVARRHGLDPDLVLAVVAVESGFRPAAVSPKGARGLMQLMPGTAAELGVGDALDPGANLDGGVRHLAALLARYDGDVRLALAAYNAGQRAVERHDGVPPYAETRAYVERVLRLYRAGDRRTKGPRAGPGAGPAMPTGSGASRADQAVPPGKAP